MNHYCKFHPASAATWYCMHDGWFLCQQCVEGTPQSATCVACEQPLQKAQAEQPAALLQQLDGYLSFALRPRCLPVLLMWALLAAVIPDMWPVAPLIMAGGAIAARQGLVVMQTRGKGRRIVPAWQRILADNGWPGALWQWLPVAIVTGGAVALLALGQVLAGVAVAGVGLLVVSALWLAVVVEDAGPASYAAALRYSLSAPWDYAVAAGFASFGWLLVLALFVVSSDLMPLFLAQAIAGALLGLWWLGLAALCGDLLARHRRDWGYGVSAVAVNQSVPAAVKKERVLVQTGRFHKALAAVADRFTTKTSDLAVWRHRDRLQALAGRAQDRLATADAYLEVLMGAAQWDDVSAVLARCRKVEANWLPASALLRLQLAEGLADIDPRQTVLLLNGLHQQHPTFARLPEAYLLLARVLADCFQATDKARQYLLFVDKQCRDAKLRGQLNELRQQLG